MVILNYWILLILFKFKLFIIIIVRLLIILNSLRWIIILILNIRI